MNEMQLNEAAALLFERHYDWLSRLMFEIKQTKKYLAIKTVILYKADFKISLS